MARFGSSRRARAFAYTLVTTAIVLLLAATEWAIERFVSDYSRGARTAIELAVALVAALVFRPLHARVEAAAEAALYRRRRQALASVERFRHELTAFDDLRELLRRAVEEIDRHFDASSCAVYLRRDMFRPEASTFPDEIEPVAIDDPLIARFRRSSLPARPSSLASQAPGSHAFAMAGAGEVNGFLAVQCKDPDFDPEEIHALTALAKDLAVAAGALDPKLRARKRTAPNNLPVDLPALIGRDADLAELGAALAQSQLVTVTGSGGVGKTSIALHAAYGALARHQDGAWFVSLAGITDAHLVAATVLAALDAPSGEASGDVARLVEHLKPRDLLLVVDNCEQVVAAVCDLVAAVRAACPGIAVLATSRETLHLPGELVMRLSSLAPEASVALFVERAAAAAPSFDRHANGATIRAICERLDGIPLAIELAAARARVLTVDEIAGRLDERFRLLTTGSATALPRQQTLAALIEWSYDLLCAQEQSLFRRLGAFRGSFSLAAACAVCASDGSCDEYHVLDVLASLADKSLLTVISGASTRYRFLESIREFAWTKALESDEVQAARDQHAEFFASLAARAYDEFDTKLPAGWLDRLEPDIDNFRAALEYSLVGTGSKLTGAQIAADCGPVFLRMELLGEGLRWCDRARAVADLPPIIAGRIEYVASMMLNNLAQEQAALECAQRAADLFGETNDGRAAIRAFSQVAQLYARNGRYDLAAAPAQQAIARARNLHEPRVLASVLRRCAFSLPEDQRDLAREYFSEAAALANAAADDDEASLALQWWAYREAEWGDLPRAVDLATQALALADRDAELYLQNQIAGWYLAQGDLDGVGRHAPRALELARAAGHEKLGALALAFCAPLHAGDSPQDAALLLGYAEQRLAQLQFAPQQDDEAALRVGADIIASRLPAGTFSDLLVRGAAMDEPSVTALERQHFGG